MVTLKLEKGFGNYLANEDFLKNKPKYLTLDIINANNETTKKIIRNDETKIIKNIKKIMRATYGKGNDKLDVLDKINILLKIESSYEIFNKVNLDFSDFCQVYMNILCPRCYNDSKHYSLNSSSKSSNPHNSGYVNLLISRTSSDYFPNLFDGILSCFVAYLIKKKEIKKWDKLFSHILLSSKDEKDLHNISDIYEQAIKIHQIYISNKDQIVIKEGNEILNKLNNSIKDKLDIFYNHVYPGLKYFYTHQSQIFVRHGLEKNTCDYRKNMIYPPNDEKHGWRIHKITDKNGSSKLIEPLAYAIEVDRFPFKNCASHSSKEIYGCIKGYITQNDYKKYGGTIHFRYENNNTIMSRDHLFGKSEINSVHWIFTYKIKPPDHLKYEVKKSVKSMLQANISILSEDYLDIFNLVTQIIINKFIILH